MNEIVFRGANNQALTDSLLVAKKFGKEHKDVLKAIRNLIEGSAQNCAVLEMFSESSYFNEQNKEQPMFIMNRDGFTLLVMGFNGKDALKFKLDYIKAFNQMEKSIEKSLMLGQNIAFDMKIKAAAWAADFLNLSDSSRLLMAKAVLDPLGLPTPDYSSSKGVLHSASDLLKKFDVKMSAIKLNKKLLEAGFIREETRQGKEKLHKYKVITDKGLLYGENKVSTQNQLETQPYWYDDKFMDLLQLLGD